MPYTSRLVRNVAAVLFSWAALQTIGCGGGYGGNGGGGGGGSAPSAPSGLTAQAGNAQVALSWSASSGATGYYVKRSTTSGTETQIATASGTTYTDTTVTNGTLYYYVVSAYNSYGTSGNSNEATATPQAATNPPATPTGLVATPGNGQVSLTWNPSTGATGYNVLRSTTSGSETQLATTTTPSYSDAAVTNGTTYYYGVSASNAAGTSGKSTEASAKPTAPATAVNVSINTLANRHVISPYVYGGAFPKDAPTITDSGLSVVRWGGNGASTYNWQLGTTNADNDYFFEDYNWSALNNSADSDSAQFIKDVKAAGSLPLMTMVMLPWVAQSQETSTTQGEANNYHWSFSVSMDGSQCKSDIYNTDAGDGLKSDCSTPLVASAADINRAYFPLLDGPPQAGDPANSVYRNEWVTDATKGMAQAFGNGVPHFYDMDNEIDIWGGTHRDIHPNLTTYDELSNIYVTEAANLKTWDPQAIRLGPVSCCWYFYWRSATGNSDTSSHGGVDFLPWWLNEVAWSDAISGTRSLDVFDIHAYPDADTSGLTTAQLQALAVQIYRDWWDPSFPSAAAYIRNGGFSIEPIDSRPFRIPRMRAIVNQAYPGTQFSMTEWSAEFAGAADFSTALGDADAYGTLGRERVYLSTRWTAPDPANPNYQALKLFTNYDGAHHGFGTVSVSDTNNGNPNLFSSYAAVDSTGKTLTVLVLNKDPQNAAQVQIALNGFTASTFVSYTLAPSAPTKISASASQPWAASQNFAPYTATLLVISGSMANTPASDWDLNPDAIMVPAGGTVALQPKLTSGAANVTLSSSTFDAFEGASTCGGSIALTTATITSTTTGTLTVTAGNTPGFCHFTVTGTDGTVSQTESGWIVVGNPAASLGKTGGDNQTATAGTVLPINLSVSLTPGQSGGTAAGASVLFVTNAGSLTNVQVGSEKVFTGNKVIAVTNSSGVASVTLTLPAVKGAVTITAEGPYGLGHPVIVPFSETAN